MKNRKIRLCGYCLGVAVLLILWSQEARVSRVIHRTVQVPLQNLVWADDPLIVRVRGPERMEVFRQVVFPKETHYLREASTTFTDHEDVYRVVRVIHGQVAGVSPGGTIKVYRKPAYDLQDTRAYHTRGLMKSPIVLKRVIQYPPSGDERILFLYRTAIDGKETWGERGHEGPDAEAEILRLLAVPPEQRQHGGM